jgi:dynactin 1
MPFKVKAEKHEEVALKVSKKYQECRQELSEAKRAANSATAELEKAREDHEITLEHAILDKETAEVERDQLLDQTEILQATIEELQLDKEIYEAEEEASLIIDDAMSDEQAQTVHIRKLQAENKRLRAVIVDFRDINKERESETKRLRQELETITEAAEESAKECTELSVKIAQDEDTITTLREQLDANNEWEEILEDVTQRANNLEEKNTQQALEIRELETENEVSTETIAEYVEFTNDLQAESSLRETELAELSRELDQERIQNAQKDATLTKYSEAFAEFQNQLQDQDMQQLMSEEKAQGMSDKFNKMMDLHRTLQADRAKDTAKTIANELTKLSEQEAREELEVMKYYLPESSGEYIDNSLRIYFRAKKMVFKASLISSLLATMDPLTNEGPEKILTNVYRYDTMYHLDYIKSHGVHFVAALSHCTLDQYRKAVSEYEDISVVETTIERTLDTLKRDELNMKELSGSIRGTDKIMRGITSNSQRICDTRPDNELILHTSLVQSSLERIRASFDAVKQYTQLVADFEPETEDRLDALVSRLRKPQTAALECIAVVTKLIQAIITLQGDSLYPQFAAGVQEVAELSDSLVAYADKAHDFAGQVIALDPNDDEETLTMDIDQLTTAVDSAMKVFSPKGINDLLRDVKTSVTHWNEYASILNNTAEIEHLPAPWVVRAQEIEAGKKQAVDSEKKLQLLIVEHQSTLIQIREREEIIDTKELEIEHLRAKHKEAVTKTENLDQLQNELQAAKTELASHKRQVDKQKEEIEELKELAENPLLAPAALPPPPENAASNAPAEKPSQEEDLSGSFATFVQALKQENRWLRQRENAKSLASIGDVLHPLRKQPDSRHKLAHAAELLEMAWSMHSPSEYSVREGSEEFSSGIKHDHSERFLHIYDAEAMGVDDMCFVDLPLVADGFDDLLMGMMV